MILRKIQVLGLKFKWVIKQQLSSFKVWTEYYGLLHQLQDSLPLSKKPYTDRIAVNNPDNDRICTSVFGYFSTSIIPSVEGGLYGYVISGKIQINYKARTENELSRLSLLHYGEYFCVKPPLELQLLEEAETKVLIIHSYPFNPINTIGGPIETCGRLRYINGCSDTLLIPPIRLGDPCLNYLHFPANIDQERHIHPSSRIGAVARGKGLCTTESHNQLLTYTPLQEGMIFVIEANARHSFHTFGATNQTDNISDSMDVIAYHPDSDWGPEDENHPMLNRTWSIETGKAIDNTSSIHEKIID